MEKNIGKEGREEGKDIKECWSRNDEEERWGKIVGYREERV